VNKACGRPDRTGTAGEGMHTSSGIMRQRVLGGERALDEHETAADEAAIRGDEDAYLKALREPTCEPAGTRPCGFVEERHDGPSGRARPRAEGEEKGQGGRLATGTRYRRILIIQWIFLLDHLPYRIRCRQISHLGEESRANP
jgi:hypothetical protein